MANNIYRNPEPVPPASQLAVLPFLAAIAGFLTEAGDVPGLRITMHRAMTREGDGYLQQVCGYVNNDGADWRGKVGRTFPVNEGIMGAAYGNGRIWRTKSFASANELVAHIAKDVKKTGDHRDPTAVELSYLAVPLLGPLGQPVLILYAACKELNFFADNDRIRRIAAMCNGFCRLFDWLQRDPFPNLRNFPLQKGQPVSGDRTVYESIQESVETVEPPRFKEVPSFNYEAAVA
jgi:hypothetical protein